MSDDFKSLLGDDGEAIEPLKQDKRVNVKSRRDDVNQSARKANAQSFGKTASDPLDTDTMQLVAPLDLLEFKRPGVQNGVYKNMRLGKYPLEATLDLHRQTVEQARQALAQFVKDCVDNDIRFALITHGKGEGRETPALLKSCVAHWLPQLDSVLAFHTAQKQHGSYGATYVLLKKSEKKKQQARDIFR